MYLVPCRQLSKEVIRHDEDPLQPEIAPDVASDTDTMSWDMVESSSKNNVLFCAFAHMKS